jgi:hypothetical protein
MNRDAEGEQVTIDAETVVETMKNGPLMVYGNVSVKDAKGTLTKKNNVTAFCGAAHRLINLSAMGLTRKSDLPRIDY